MGDMIIGFKANKDGEGGELTPHLMYFRTEMNGFSAIGKDNWSEDRVRQELDWLHGDAGSTKYCSSGALIAVPYRNCHPFVTCLKPFIKGHV